MKRIKLLICILCATCTSPMQSASFLKDFGAYKPWRMLALAATAVNLCTKAEDTFLVNYEPRPFTPQFVDDVCPFSDGSFGVLLWRMQCLNIGADGEVNAYHVFETERYVYLYACTKKDDNTMYVAGRMYVGSWVGYAALVDKNCTPIWERTISGTSFRDVATTPDGGAIFVGSASSSIYGLKLSPTGDKSFDFLLETESASIANAIIVSNNNIYIAGQAFNTMAFARYSLSGVLAYFKTYATSSSSTVIHDICATGDGYIAFVAIESNDYDYLFYGKVAPTTGDTLYIKFFTRSWMEAYHIIPTDNGGFAFAVEDSKRYLLTFHANGALLTHHRISSYSDLIIVPYNGAHYVFGTSLSNFLFFAKIPTTNQSTDCISLLINGYTNIVDLPNTILDRNVSLWDDTTAKLRNTTRTIHRHNITVQRTCINTYAPTFSPTSAPTPAPSGNTLMPSKAPTKSPTTKSPTKSPITKSPTKSPVTKSPTQPPTTASPTRLPTGSPTDPPTKSPTGAPTGTPTDAPTGAPTTSPTGAPTNSPTKSPIAAPTGAPTAPPTGAPTTSPTGAPTDSPTIPVHCATDACTEYNIVLSGLIFVGLLINYTLCLSIIKKDGTDEVPLCCCCKKKVLTQFYKKPR